MFYGVCWLFAVLKLFETFNFPWLLKECFLTAYNIALYNKCNINVRAGGLFEKGIIQKIVVI